MTKLPAASLHQLQLQQLTKQQQLTSLRQKLLDEKRARTVLHATTMITKISMLARKEPARFDHLKKAANGNETNIGHKQHIA